MGKRILVTGGLGLVGSAAVRRFVAAGHVVRSIDNNGRREFFGQSNLLASGVHGVNVACDISKPGELRYFAEFDADVIIHCAAQPSHDYSARDPIRDFDVNARGTLLLLEMARSMAKPPLFIFMSTNKVYGDLPSVFRSEEKATRYEIVYGITGFDECAGLDEITHSPFGCSKAAADLYVQEYNRYFGLPTVALRAGCITGPSHPGAELHGFLAYLVTCAKEGKKYAIYGYKGKQVRDNLHVEDLVDIFQCIIDNPEQAVSDKVYNVGGGPDGACSILEAIAMIEEFTGKKIETEYVDAPRKGDHIWWVTNMGRFRAAYPQWTQRYDIRKTLEEMCR